MTIINTEVSVGHWVSTAAKKILLGLKHNSYLKIFIKYIKYGNIIRLTSSRWEIEVFTGCRSSSRRRLIFFKFITLTHLLTARLEDMIKFKKKHIRVCISKKETT